MEKNKRGVRHSFVRLVKEAIKIRPSLAFYFCIFAGAGSIIPIATSYMIKFSVQYLSWGEAENKYIGLISVFSLILLIANGLKLFSQYKADSLMTYIRMTYSKKLSMKLFEIPYEKIEDESFLTEHYKAFESLESSSNGVEKVCNLSFFLMAEIISLLSLLLVISEMSVVFVVSILIFLLWKTNIQILVEKEKYEKQNNYSRYMRIIEYIFDSCTDAKRNKELRVYQSAGLLNKKVEKALNGINDILRHIFRKEVTLSLFCNIGLGIVFLSFSIIVALNYIAGLIDISEIAMYISVMLSIISMVEHIAKEIGIFVNENINVSILFDFLDDSLPAKMSEMNFALKKGEAIISVDNVSFMYPGTNKYVLKNISFDIQEGERVAVVGINGSGKSTLMKCMSGVYNEYEGTIRICGDDIKSIPREELYLKIGALYQDTCLYAFSLQENIASADNGIDKRRVEYCIEALELAEKLPEASLENMVLKLLDSKGLVLSGGEEQKVSLARIVYKDPNIVFLDEPTSRFDILSEDRLLQKLSVLFAGKTLFWITQNLPTTKYFDRIIVLGENKVLEIGSHEELMKLRGNYYQMYNVQSEYYKEVGR